MEKNTNIRYYLLDNIRGINLINMIIYHGMWDLIYIYGKNIEWYKGITGHIWQQMICYVFIILSGFCWSLGHNQIKRGIEVSIAGIIISAVTLIFMPQNRVVFGVLTLLGICMLIMKPLHKILDKVNVYFGIILSIMLFIGFYNINNGIFGFGTMYFVKLPEKLYANYFTTLLGFTHKGFFSTDYFSIIPWIFLFILGYFLYRFVKEKALFGYLKGKNIPILSTVGKNTLLIYMLHQPVLYLIFELCTMIKYVLFAELLH